MKIAITGADRPIGALLCRDLGADHEVRPIGLSAEPESDLGLTLDSYHRADLRLPSSAIRALKNMDVVVHGQPYDPGSVEGPEHEVLDVVARGTYCMINAAHELGIGRVILLSHLSLLADYPEDYVVGSHWMPNPRAEAQHLAPYTAELVGRELARVGKLACLCLRFGDLDAAEGTSGDDVVGAVRKALYREVDSAGYQWSIEHVASAGRFAPAGR